MQALAPPAEGHLVCGDGCGKSSFCPLSQNQDCNHLKFCERIRRLTAFVIRFFSTCPSTCVQGRRPGYVARPNLQTPLGARKVKVADVSLRFAMTSQEWIDWHKEAVTCICSSVGLVAASPLVMRLHADTFLPARVDIFMPLHYPFLPSLSFLCFLCFFLLSFSLCLLFFSASPIGSSTPAARRKASASSSCTNSKGRSGCTLQNLQVGGLQAALLGHVWRNSYS